MPHEFITRTNENEVVINNMRFRVNGSIGWSLANSYGKKVQMGDPGPDDHPLNSTITQNSWTGGIGTKKSKGDDTRNNSWFSTMWMLTENLLCLPPKTLEYIVAGEEASLAIPHSKLGNFQYGTFGKKMRLWNETTDAWDAVGGSPVSSGSAVWKGVTWGTDTVARKIYIPMGSTYETFDGSVFAAGAGGEGAIRFVVWQNKLIKLDAAGVVKVSTDGVAWTVKGSIPDELAPRNLFVFFDKANAHVVHVVTSGRVYALDYDNGRLVETDMEWPDHPSQGLGAVTWRADAYLSVGLGIHRNANGLIQAVGPDGREGLPEEYMTGYFTDLIGSYNDLMGIILGGTQDFVPATETADLEMPPPGGMYSQDSVSAYAMMLGYNGLGWHPRWIGMKPPTNITVSSTGGVYRVFWGSKGAMYSQVLPIGYYNPVYNQLQTPLARYARHETPYYTWGSDDIPKIAKQFECKTHGCDANNYFDIWFRTDDTEGWGNGVDVGTPLARINTNGEHHLELGYEYMADRLSHLGLQHEKIQFAIDAYGNPADEYQTPAIEWHTVVGRKWMRPFFTWNFQIDATQPYYDVSPREQFQTIIDAATKKGGSTLVIGDEVFDVDITATDGNKEPMPAFKGYINVSAALMEELDA